MPLYLALHTVEVVTAKVSLAMIMLVDHVKKATPPPELRCRGVLPTSSETSISLWDAPSAEELEAWLNTNLQYDSAHKVCEVQEEFSWGLTSLLATSRAADKVAAGSRGAFNTISATASKAGDNIKQQLEALDQRTHIISRIKNVGLGGGAAQGSQDGTGPHTGAETGPDASGSSISASMTAGLAKAGSTLSWLGQSFKEGINTATAAARTAASQATAPSGPQPPRQPAAPPAAPSPPPMPSMPAPASRYDSGEARTGAGGVAGGVAPTTTAATTTTTTGGHTTTFGDDLSALDRLHQLPVSKPAAATPSAAGSAGGADSATGEAAAKPQFTLE